MMNHSGKTALVTGAGRGIGRAIAEALAQGGARVAIVDLDAESARAAAADIAQKHGVATWAAQLDVSDKHAVVEVLQRLERELGPPDILVNNAAITSTRSTVASMTMDYWDHEIAVNLSGAFYCAKQVLPGMAARKWGRIINISSQAAAMGGYGQCSYAASKAGLCGLTKTIALEHARDNITCNVLLPGLVNTPAAIGFPEEIKQRILKRVPIRRAAEPPEIAAVASFLASDQASYINGAEINISAGMELFTF